MRPGRNCREIGRDQAGRNSPVWKPQIKMIGDLAVGSREPVTTKAMFCPAEGVACDNVARGCELKGSGEPGSQNKHTINRDLPAGWCREVLFKMSHRIIEAGRPVIFAGWASAACVRGPAASEPGRPQLGSSGRGNRRARHREAF